LSNGYIDYGLLHNKLAYDLFKSMSAPGAPRVAPDLGWTEVFVNGHYQGMYECGTRVDRYLLGWDSEEPDPDDGPVLYKFVASGNNFSQPNPDGFAQKLPKLEQGFYRTPYLHLVEFVRTAPTDSFIAQVGNMVDVAAILDWHLLLNCTENQEGINANVYLAGHPADGKGLFFIPWDYDKSFYGEREWFSNALTTRLWRDHPDYRQRLAARWSDLRQGPWSDTAILEMLDREQRHLEGYIDWDLHQWNARYARGRTLAESVDSTRTQVLKRLAFLDQFLVEQMMTEADGEDFVEPEEDGL
jgi:hypothetical protein